ncbi:MAG: hypothetical protein L0K44_02255 [Yaniella sp.]|nr:hypothetical protein [Yaniella sp.]
MHSETEESSRTKSTFSRFLASILAAVLSVTGLVALGPAAVAAPVGISVSALHNGGPLADDAVVASGDKFTLRVVYDNGVDTSSPLTVGLPDGVTFDESSLQVPSGNTAIQSVDLVHGDVQITFYDTADWGETNQGVWDLDMTFDEVERTESQTITWTVGPETYTREVIVRDGDAQEESVSDHLAKSVDTSSFSEYVSVNQGVVTVNEDILEHEINYTLEMHTDRDTDRSEISITDELSEYLMYNQDSFEAEITTWDEIGWNSTTSDFEFNPEFEDNGFVYTGGVENPSELTVAYSAQVDPDQLDALTEALQAQFDAVEGTGGYGLGLANTVSFGEYGQRDTNITIGGNREESDSPSVVEDYLDKSAANTGLDQFVSFDESGNVVLDEDVVNHGIEYTLTVNSASERIGFTIADQLSEYLGYDEGSFEASIATSEDGGWTWDENPFEFEPEIDGNSFTFTGDIDEQSELTITYTASVAEGQLEALRDAIQQEFDDLGVEPGEYRVQLDNTVTFGGDQEREANVGIGNNRGDGEGPENVSNHFDKQAGETALSEFVSIYEGVVSVDDKILEAVINYTLTVNTDADTDRSDVTISDEISEYLTYDQDSFNAEITTWGPEGWNQETNDFDFEPEFSDNGFTFEGDIENPSELTITYSASITEAQREALEEALQGEFDALEVGYGNFGLNLENTATFGGETRRDDVPINGSAGEPPVPQPGDAFDKGADFESVNITTAEDGSIVPPQEITYTFSANLSQWDGNAEDGYLNDDDFTLDRNVVISDALPEQAEWDTSAEDFISGMELTQAEDFDGDSAAFAADDYVNQYAVVGQKLYINIGQDSETNAEISAKALITTTDGLTSSNDGGIERYELINDAQFTFNDDGDPYGSSVEVTLNDRGDGLEDEAKFSKTALDDDGPVYVEEGESATLEYRFQANGDWSNAVDVTNSYIVDHRDPNVFDFSDLEQTVESISGTLHGDAVSFDESHFDLSANDEGELVITLNESGIAAVEDSWAEPTAPYVVDIALNTVPLSDRQTLNVENSATLYGSDDYPLYWSETTSEASSYGDEAEVRKTIRDSFHEEWTQNLRVEIDEDGELIQDEYVYNLAFVPHGNYSSVEISSVVDELPKELEFVGFVDHDDVDTGANPTDGPQDIGGNLEAVYNEDDHTVSVQQQEGTLLEQQENISANVLVRIVEFEEDVPVANFFGSSSAEYTPSDGYPISIAKVNSQNDEVVINDPESRFQVFDSEDNVVVEDAFVEDGQLRVLDEDGEASGLVVREPGTYYVEETVAPEGYELSTDRIAVVVDTYGNSEQQTFENDPIPNVEIIKGDGDADEGTITNDANTEEDAEQYGHLETRDVVINVENTGTEDLVDVVLTDETQSGADIESLVWTLPNGDTVEATANDDGVLTAEWDGPWAVGETITGTATLTLTAGDELHTNLASVDAVGAASGTPVEDEDPYNADPADRDYAIGDYVWIDSNNDGVQDDEEEPLEDVTVALYN